MAPASSYCGERIRLLDEFVAAVSEYLRVESAGLAALVRGDESDFDAELEVARRRKEAAREAIRAHQWKHGC